MRRSPATILLASAVAYLLITTAITWPLVLHPGSLVPSDLGDSLLNIWLMAWNARVTPLTGAWWNAAMFYPATGTMAFSEHLLGLAPITSPVIWGTGNALLAYNVAFFLSFPLCGLAAQWLARTVTRRHDAAFLAGLAFAFAPYRMAQLPHVQVESAYWMPLTLLGLHLYLRDGRTRWLVLFAGSWVMQALACGYYLIYLSVLVALWLAWFAAGRVPWKQVARVVAAWFAGALVLAPILYQYWRVHRAYGLRRWPPEIEAFSADVASVLKAPDILAAWGWLRVFERPEAELFPGLTIVALVSAAVWLGWKELRHAHRGSARLSRILLAAAVVTLLVAASPAVFGPWKLHVFGVRLLSVSAAAKPFSIALLLFLAVSAMHPTVRLAWARRSSLAFYTFAAVAMFVFALGPAPSLMGTKVLYKAPYAWLMLVPGVEGVRVPARFWMLAVLCLSMAAALALRFFAERRPRWMPWLAIAACGGILIDGWPRPVPMWAPPSARPSHVDAVARMDLPLAPLRDIRSLYRSIEHRRPLLNGYSGYFAPHYWILLEVLAAGDREAVASLGSLGPLEVVVDREAEGETEARALLSAIPGARLMHEEAAYSTYLLPGGAPRPSRQPLSGDLLSVERFTTVIKPETTQHLTDGDLITRWDAGRPQAAGDQLVVDLGVPREVTGVELSIGSYVADFPRALRIETSADGAAWVEAPSASPGLEALWAAIDEPRTIPLRFGITPRIARYVRLTQTGADDRYYWSVAELRVFGH